MESAHNSQGSIAPPTTANPVTPVRAKIVPPELEGNSLWRAFESSGVDDDEGNNDDNDDNDNTQANETAGTLGTPVQSSTPKRKGDDRLFLRSSSPSREEFFTRPLSPARVANLPPIDLSLAQEHDATISARTAADAANTNEPIFEPSPTSLASRPTENSIKSLTKPEVYHIVRDFHAAYALAEFRAVRIRQITADVDALRERITEDDARFLALEAAYRTLEDTADSYPERLRRYEEAEGRSEGLMATMEQEIEALNKQLGEATRGRDTERRAKDAMTARLQEELRRGEQAAQRELAAADALRLAQADIVQSTQQLAETRAIVAERDVTVMMLRLELATATSDVDRLQNELNGARDDIGTLSGAGVGTGGGRARGVIATLKGIRPARASLRDQLQDSDSQENQDGDDEDDDDEDGDEERDNVEPGGNDPVIASAREFQFVRNLLRDWPAQTFVGDWAHEFPELLMRGMTPETSQEVEEIDEMTQTDPPVTIASGMLRGGWMNVDGNGSGDTPARPDDREFTSPTHTYPDGFTDPPQRCHHAPTLPQACAAVVPGSESSCPSPQRTQSHLCQACVITCGRWIQPGSVSVSGIVLFLLFLPQIQLSGRT